MRSSQGRRLRPLLSPSLLDLVNAAPEVKAEALPFFRIAFLFSSGMLVFYMLGGALRSAGDVSTPMILGIVMTVLNLVLNVILIRGLRADSRVRHRRFGDGDDDRFRSRSGNPSEQAPN